MGKEFFELNEDVLGGISGGTASHNLKILSDEQMTAQYEVYRKQYSLFINNGLDKSTNPEITGTFKIIVDTLEYLESELTKRGIPFSRG